MNKTLLALCALLLPCLVFTQTIKVKKKIVTVDGTYFCHLEGSALSAGYRIKNKEGKLLFTVRTQSYNDPDEVTTSNPKGRVNYEEFAFPGLEGVAETAPPLLPRAMARLIYEHGLVKDGELDLEAAQNFLQSTGTPFSDKRPEKVILYQK